MQAEMELLSVSQFIYLEQEQERFVYVAAHLICHSRDKLWEWGWETEIKSCPHARHPMHLSQLVSPRCLSCPVLMSYKNTLYTHILHPQGEVMPQRSGQFTLHLLLKVKPVDISINGQVAQQSGHVPRHSDRRDCLSVLVCACNQTSTSLLL